MAIPNLYAIRDWCLNQFARKKDIPTKTSDLDNDSGFVTSQYPVDILGSREEVDANTSDGKVVDALVIKNSLGGLSFGQDSSGNWGYKIGGADTVIPFSGGKFPKYYDGVTYSGTRVASRTHTIANVTQGTYLLISIAGWQRSDKKLYSYSISASGIASAETIYTSNDEILNLIKITVSKNNNVVITHGSSTASSSSEVSYISDILFKY